VNGKAIMSDHHHDNDSNGNDTQKSDPPVAGSEYAAGQRLNPVDTVKHLIANMVNTFLRWLPVK